MGEVSLGGFSEADVAEGGLALAVGALGVVEGDGEGAVGDETEDFGVFAEHVGDAQVVHCGFIKSLSFDSVHFGGEEAEVLEVTEGEFFLSGEGAPDVIYFWVFELDAAIVGLDAFEIIGPGFTSFEFRLGAPLTAIFDFLVYLQFDCLNLTEDGLFS